MFRRSLPKLSALMLALALAFPSVATAEGGLQPEDIGSIEAIAVSSDGQTAYVSGKTCFGGVECQGKSLFRSTDGGTTWEELPATLYQGHELLLPSAPNQEIFAKSVAGLQVSEDGGQSFRLVAAPGDPFTGGGAAVSPAFGGADSSVLVGWETLMRYDHSTGLSTPVPVAAHGPLEPAFAPDYPADPRFMIGHVTISPTTNSTVPTVTICEGLDCTSTIIESAPSQQPRLIPAPDFATSGTLYAYTQNWLFVSQDGGASFDELTNPAPSGSALWDLVLLGDGSLVASAWGINDGGGLYRSTDGGNTWATVRSGAAYELAGAGSLAIAKVGTSFDPEQLVCSDDYGVTWAARCP